MTCHASQSLQAPERIVVRMGQEFRPGDDVPHLAGPPLVSPVQLAVQNQPPADAGAHEDARQILDPAPNAKLALAQGRQVDVVLDEGGDTKALLDQIPERRVAPAQGRCPHHDPLAIQHD